MLNMGKKGKDMSTETRITCDKCGVENSVHAFCCQSCGNGFDGRAGNTIPLNRQLSVRSQSIRIPSGKSGASFQAPVPKEWAGRLPATQGRVETRLAIVGFSDDAVVRQLPVPPDQVSAYSLVPDALTNEAAGIRLAGELREKHMPHARLNLVVLGDGEPTAGGGPSGDDKQAALNIADDLKRKGARIATVGVHGPTMDFKHLQSLASTPALAFDAHVGGIARVFVHATQSITTHRWGQAGAELVVFVIDESGSMEEDNKEAEVEEAVAASVALLKRLQSSAI